MKRNHGGHLDGKLFILGLVFQYLLHTFICRDALGCYYYYHYDEDYYYCYYCMFIMMTLIIKLLF